MPANSPRETIQIKERGPVLPCKGNRVRLIGVPIPDWMTGPNGRCSAYWDVGRGILRLVGANGAATIRKCP